MKWPELGWLVAILAVFVLVDLPWGALVGWAKEEIKKPPKDVI
ncbi:MAG TPA: hypothetical protein VGS78_03510 [Candidatus Sulfotelmatobacter sp.]|nr:hypothetical protein [Candidatus Sulfotelmatobacter sp.]